MKKAISPTVAWRYEFFTFLNAAASSFMIVYLFTVQRHEPVSMMNLSGYGFYGEHYMKLSVDPLKYRQSI
jgi:hypothetical protein